MVKNSWEYIGDSVEMLQNFVSNDRMLFQLFVFIISQATTFQ